MAGTSVSDVVLKLFATYRRQTKFGIKYKFN